jgi:hypothetical protein
MPINTVLSLDVRWTLFVQRTVLTIVEEYEFPIELKYENARQFYIRIPAPDIDACNLPPVFINVIRRKKNLECQTLELMKRNQKVVYTCIFGLLKRLANRYRSTCRIKKSF